MKVVKKLFLLAMAVSVMSCGEKPSGNTSTGEEKPAQAKPQYSMRFDADSAYSYVESQVKFGPRVPQTMPHALTANYLNLHLAKYCDTAFIQQAQITGNDGKALLIKNIIGVFNASADKRILLCAHWDTRPQADEDPDHPDKPADGANDGASGVGVLMEVARQLSEQRPSVGIDIIFFDAEDMGVQGGGAETWCLGSQYWAKRPHIEGYNAEFGILLDMVGAKDAIFLLEKHSYTSARWVMDMVWRNASSLGHGNRFVSYPGGYITDDHYFVNKIMGIPVIDIIHYDMNRSRGFGAFWHTHDDNMDIIDKETLGAVGETILKTVWETNP